MLRGRLTNNIHDVVIDSKIVLYDVASENDLEKAKKFYGPNYKYIGSGYIHSVNGVIQDHYDDDPIEHFFIEIDK